MLRTFTDTMRPLLHILRLDQVSSKPFSIFQQLQLEEALLRTSTKNYLILNQKSVLKDAKPDIVMGISGKMKDWLSPNVVTDNIAVIKRFSGGGTVLIDSNTVFVSFIMNTGDSPSRPFPRDLMNYATNIFKEVWRSPLFSMRGHDFCLGDRKFGGNAQSITRGRFCHHTSMLFDFNRSYMDRYLLIPILSKQPEYRSKRGHSDFLCTLKDFSYSHENGLALESVMNNPSHGNGLFFSDRLVEVLDKSFECVDVSYDSVLPQLQVEHDRRTHVLNNEDFERA